MPSPRCALLKKTANRVRIAFEHFPIFMGTALNKSQIQDALARLPGWEFTAASISKTYRFAGFPEAICFITEMAFACEKANHHPEMSNVYNTVTIRLRTHDLGSKVTQKDVDLAREIEMMAKKSVQQATI